jgi:hypothetical protein
MLKLHEDDEPRRRGATTAERPTGLDRSGFVTWWAVVGVLVAILALQTWVRWILSGTEFTPVPIIGPDVYPTWRLVILRVTEVLSIVEMSALLWLVVIRPRLRDGHFGLDAKITIGLLIGSVTDGVLNMHEYLFAWNQHSVNLGSWASFLPLASPDHQSRYAEALIWGIPQYTYYCITVAMVACVVIRRRRAKNPDLSNAKALAGVFGAALIFDFVLENFFIRVDHAYAFAKTPSQLTIFDGSQYQFPLYESVFVAALGVAFTALRLSAVDSPDGLSFVERGVTRLPAAWREPARWFAVIGFCVTCLFVLYHLPLNWFGLNGDSLADLPSYMLPAD